MPTPTRKSIGGVGGLAKLTACRAGFIRRGLRMICPRDTSFDAGARQNAAPWASRPSLLMAASGLAAEGEESSELPVGFVPTVKTWAWVALQLRLVPELLLAVRLLHMSLASLPLDEVSQARLRDSIQELDAGFGSNILNMTDGELRSLSSLPDALENAGMPIARMVCHSARCLTPYRRRSLTPASTCEALGPSTKHASRVGSTLEADRCRSS